jgi:adenylate cyclase
VDERETAARTFLIADLRGYSRYTERHGDEAAARLARRFTEIVNETTEGHQAAVVEFRGDEALVVFVSARQAIRAAVDLQGEFEEETAVNPECALRVGIGIDSGEAVQLQDGTFRGAALNVAARLCSRAHGGQTLVSEATSRLAGRLNGVEYRDRGRVCLKNIPDQIHILEVFPERGAPAPSRWTGIFSGTPRTTLG